MFVAMSPPPPPGGGSGATDLHDVPPIVTNIWVQKILDSSKPGNVLMRIQYMEDSTLPDSIMIYHLGDSSLFHDDGLNGDSIAGDNIYAAYLTEDTDAFTTQMEKMNDSLEARGSYIIFHGHDGKKVTSDMPHFDLTGFASGALVSMPLDFGQFAIALPCPVDGGILRENSLFITDLNVVGGNSSVWGPPSGLDFGTLMQHMANCSGTNCTREFIKQWLKNWTNTAPMSVNGQSINQIPTPSIPVPHYQVSYRQDIITFVIEPWLNAAGVTGTYCGDVNHNSSTMDFSNWETFWDLADENALLSAAPFKLTAIVNRVDLRGNSAYAPVVGFNAGETRFVFSLISPCDIPFGGGTTIFTFQNMPPKAQDQIGSGPSPDFSDWQGMNVIFEYGNVQTNECDLINFAQQWVDLSNMTRGGSTYMAALQAITNTVTLANANPGKTNGSAINRVRTNEKVLFNPDKHDWQESTWEFRQFELDPSTSYLKQVPLTNTPIYSANGAGYLGGSYGNLSASFTYLPKLPTDQHNLIDWVYKPSNTNNVLNGNYLMPASYNSSSLLAGVGHISAQYTHYWDFNWEDNTTYYNYDATWTATSRNNPIAKQLRHQVSLNTCSGCHAGETKTEFTQIRPLGYNDAADYWSSNPLDYNLSEFGFGGSTSYRAIDVRFFENYGGWTSSSQKDYDKTEVSANIYHAKVSAFLTGRRYRGALTSTPGFTDDNGSASGSMDGLFYVNDPSNDSYVGTGHNNLGPIGKFGYNDLMRRRDDLCWFTHPSCGQGGSVVLLLTKSVLMNVLPIGGH